MAVGEAERRGGGEMTVIVNGSGLEGIGLATGGSGSGKDAVPLYSANESSATFSPPTSNIAPRAPSWTKEAAKVEAAQGARERGAPRHRPDRPVATDAGRPSPPHQSRFFCAARPLRCVQARRPHVSNGNNNKTMLYMQLYTRRRTR